MTEPHERFATGQQVWMTAEIVGLTPSGEMVVLVEDARHPGGLIGINVDPENLFTTNEIKS